MKKTESHPPQQIRDISVILGQKQMYLRSNSIAKEHVRLKGQKIWKMPWLQASKQSHGDSSGD